MTPHIPQEKLSPDMHPLPELPFAPLCTFDSGIAPADEPVSESLFTTPYNDLSKWRNRPSIGGSHEGEADPESPSVGTGSSVLESGLDGEEYAHIRMDSPPPLDQTLDNIKDERRYRMLLQHEFHPSRTLSLAPTQCHITR